MKKLWLALGTLLLAIGFAILVYDLVTFHRYGVHVNDVAAITDDGYVIPWPTGEDPWFARVSIRAWSFFFWLAGAVLYGLPTLVGRPYRGRVMRGTE